MYMYKRSVVTIALVAAAFVDATSGQAVYVPERLAEGVYALIPQPRLDDLDGNSLVVIGKESVLVVDTGGSLESGRLVAAQIRKLSPLPVRYIVNTHWHYDHVLGNGGLLEAWPAAKVVGHEETGRIGASWAQYYTQRTLATFDATKTRIANDATTGQRDGRALSGYEHAVAKAQHANIDRLERKLRQSAYILPDVVFRDQLQLDLGGRSVEVLNFGRGNTPGDAVVHVRDAGIIAAGDLLVHPVPYGFNSFPHSWSVVMRRLAALRPATAIVPGHGPIQRDHEYLLTVADLLSDVVRQVRICVIKNMSLDETRKAVDLTKWRTLLATDDERRFSFATNFEAPIIERAWREARGEF
jgi:glyoxylase-like metal-dependent hydrolase (beta-lactamase superfamily II)